jgi:hypothetical protein
MIGPGLILTSNAVQRHNGGFGEDRPLAHTQASDHFGSGFDGSPTLWLANLFLCQELWLFGRFVGLCPVGVD